MWETGAATPLRHFLDQTRDMFPAHAPPFLRLLCALAHGKLCAGYAAGYLDAISRLTCEHSSWEAGLRQVSGGGVHADQPLPIQDTGLFVPQVRMCCPPPLLPFPSQLAIQCSVHAPCGSLVFGKTSIGVLMKSQIQLYVIQFSRLSFAHICLLLPSEFWQSSGRAHLVCTKPDERTCIQTVCPKSLCKETISLALLRGPGG